MEHRFVFVFRYLSLILFFLGVVCLFVWGLSSHTNHSSIAWSNVSQTNQSIMKSYHTYTNYHIGFGIGVGTLITTAYLELYIFKLKRRLKKFKFTTANYTFSESAITIHSPEFEATMNWEIVQDIRKVKGRVLLETYNYSCPSLLFLDTQISDDQISWIWHRIRKTNNE